MPFLVLYLIKLSISLCVVWLFYQLLLRRLTFYNWNRWYLLGYSLLCFVIPFIDVHRIVDTNPAAEPIALWHIPVIQHYTPAVSVVPVIGRHESGGPTGWAMLISLFVLGAVILIGRLFIRWLSLRHVRRQAILVSQAGDKVRIYQIDEKIVPFSFGNAVYINQHLHTEKEWEEIILHEFVHIRQRHTVDILVAELICALNWYNPFAWLIRFSIRQNLEFIADNKVLENGVDKKGYQYHLLKVIGQPAYRLANNFNFSSLKKRITMMNRIKSAKLHMVKFLFVLPLLATLLVAFRGQYEGFFQKHAGPAYLNVAGIISDFNTYEPIQGVSIVDIGTGISATTDERGFFRMQVLAVHDSVGVILSMTKAGFDSGRVYIFRKKLSEPMGHIEIDCLHRTNTDYKYGVFMGFQNYPAPPLEPTYEDALKALEKVRHDNEEMNKYFIMQKQHPEVFLFYTAEDHQKQIVFFQDGHYEKYGYPDGPTVADMETKFGKMPGMFTGKQGSAGGYYVQQWAKISAQAEKEFHTNNPNARHIVFPGDSRVIVVPMTGKPRIYDMDNDRDDKERPAFEREYGKLPDCVPQPGHQSPGQQPSEKPQTRTDTVPPPPLIHADGHKSGRISPQPLPQNTDASKDVPIRPQPVFQFQARGYNPINPQPAYVVDGKIVNDPDIKNMNPGEVYSIMVLKSNTDSLARIYGENARNGVILITTRSHAPKPDDILNQRVRIITPDSYLMTALHITLGDMQVSGMVVGQGSLSRKYLCLLNGKVLPDGTNVGTILKSNDLAAAEMSTNVSVMARFGGHDGQTLMNIITQSGKDIPDSYLLTYELNNSTR